MELTKFQKAFLICLEEEFREQLGDMNRPFDEKERAYARFVAAYLVRKFLNQR